MWLIVNKRLWGENGPIVNVGLQSANSLAMAGETVEFVTAGHARDWRDDARRHYGLQPHPNLTVRLVRRLRLARMSSSLPLCLYPFIRLAAPAARRESLYVMTRDSSLLPYLALLKRLYRARVFLEVHHAYACTDRLQSEGLALSAHERKCALLERRYCGGLDGLVCITEPQAALYRQAFPQLKQIVLPLGVTLAGGLSPREKFMRRTLIYIGDLSKRKGLDTLLHAMQHVELGIMLMLVGGSDNACARVREQAVMLGVSESVAVMGSLAPAELLLACATRASAGVLPLEDTFYNRVLTSPAKLCDYHAFGLPVIASRLPTTETLLCEGREALFFTPGEAPSLAGAINELFADESRFVELALGSECKGHARAWSNRAASLLEFARSTLGRETRHACDAGAVDL
jgi:glycosyltransferase involved in cell wall biosynthesis